MTEYRGYRIEKAAGTVVFSAANTDPRFPNRHRPSNKFNGWSFTDPDGYVRYADTLKEAKRRIDSLLDM